MLRQDRDVVLAALPQRRQIDRHHVEPIVQILAETARIDLVLQILVRRRHDARVHLARLAGADALELLLLQDAQHLDLEFRTHARDFVEEDGAAVGRLETAGLVLDGAGERPLDVAEQLAFQQALGQGAAVDADVGAVGAAAEAMDGAGDEFLAGAGLADDEHAGLSGSNQARQASHVAQRRTLADDARQAAASDSRLAGLGLAKA